MPRSRRRSLWAHERLVFEMYGQALQGRPHSAHLLEGVVESWLTGDRRGVDEAAEHTSSPRTDRRADRRIDEAQWFSLTY